MDTVSCIDRVDCGCILNSIEIIFNPLCSVFGAEVCPCCGIAVDILMLSFDESVQIVRGILELLVGVAYIVSLAEELVTGFIIFLIISVICVCAVEACLCTLIVIREPGVNLRSQSIGVGTGVLMFNLLNLVIKSAVKSRILVVSVALLCDMSVKGCAAVLSGLENELSRVEKSGFITLEHALTCLGKSINRAVCSNRIVNE